MTHAVIFNRIIVSLQTLDLVWGLGYKLRIGQNFYFSQFFLLPPHSHITRKKKRGHSVHLLYQALFWSHLSHPPGSPILFSFFLQRQSFLAIPLIIFTSSFWNPWYFSYVFSDAVTRSGSIPYANSNIVTFSVLFLFYSPDTQISNVLFNHCCACQEKVFIELSTTISRYFSWAVTVHYIRQPGALLDSGFQGTVPSICQQ